MQVVATVPALRSVRNSEGALVVKLDRTQLKTLIASQAGRFVSLTFRKLTGNVRTLTGRLGVTSHLRGGVNQVERSDRPYLTVFDVQLSQYRTVNLSTVSSVRAGGRTYVLA